MQKAGRGILEFAVTDGRSVLQRAQATSPLKFVNPRNHGRAAWTYASSYGGGLVGGDHVHIDVRLRRRASAVLLTQASTKVYRSKRSSGQSVNARIESGALLVAAPDPVTCFAGSSFTQEQRYDLASGASLVLVDWLTSGRRASGERWAFDRYHSRIGIWRDGVQILHESLLLDPADGVLTPRLGRFNTLALVVITGPAVSAGAARALELIGAAPLQPRAELVISASPLEKSGALIRLAGSSVEQAGRALRGHLSFLPPLLGDDPWERKW